VNKVKADLITTRRIIFTPAVELKDELKSTAVVITCYDRNGNEVKRVTSADDAEIDDGTSDTPGGGSGPGSNGGVTPGEAGNGDDEGE
jgi:hypothetical protein